MKKRVMKKYIPKDTMYCRGCPWRKFIKIVRLDRTNCEHKDECLSECWSNSETSCRVRVYRCEYLGYTDNNEDSLLWDGCKECGEKLPKF